MVESVDGCPETYVVDTHLLSVPEVMSAYLIDAERPAVVDPGAATALPHLLDALDEVGIDPTDVAEIVPTHAHLDHAGAAGALARECPNATVRIHERGRPFLVDESRLNRLVESARDAMGEYAEAYGDPEPVPADRCESLADSDRVDLGDRTLTAIDAPGHAPHQHCLLDDADRALFAGDAVGAYWGGELHPATPAPDFDLEESLETLDRLDGRDVDHLLVGHFGRQSDPGQRIDDYRRLLPEWVDAVQSAREDVGDDVGAIVDRLSDRWTSPIVEGEVAGVLRYLDEDGR